MEKKKIPAITVNAKGIGNLFSILTAQDRNQNSELVLTLTECWLKVDVDEVLYGSLRLNGSLFKASIESILLKEVIQVYCVVTYNSLLRCYHEEDVHQDRRRIKNIREKDFCISMKNSEPCVYGKVHRLSFGTTKKVFELGELITEDDFVGIR
ncbi:retrovirus-related Pol polyprotein from transposon TNT 1-94 [Trichonephila inaurata madagascariensis]|uniref:Retrovirus-related Pol polyprotein from transposon TNT 1-94 n=1 Tax=Trichonephila inaurata madagascariensis TaxID=2747483 RepID=A0A8X7CC21_9ARAC|nr:retrovirus-related Pol polyprotein from transposon TNT 1-94 [Trichonephila inaurata madagascariensis]